MNNIDLQELHSKLLEMISDLDMFCKEHNIEYVLCAGNVIGAVRHKGFIPWDDDLDVQMTRDNYDKFLLEFENNEKYFLQKENDDYPLQFSKLRANNTTFIEDIPYKNKYKNIHQGIYIDIFPVDKVSICNRKAKLQALFSNILVTQSVFLRGYPKSHMNFKKRIAIIIAMILLPLRNYFRKYVKQFNNAEDFEYYCSYYGSRIKRYHEKNTYIPPFERLPYENLELPVMNNYRMYLQKTYGDYMRLPSDAEREYAIHAKCFSLTEDYKGYLQK